MRDPTGRNGETPGPAQLAGWLITGAAALGAVAALALGWRTGPAEPIRDERRALPAEPEPTLVTTPLPDYYPCNDCHEDEPIDRTVRVMEFEHEDLELAHGDLWCFHCHQAEDRDVLHLADGGQVDFEESWRLCTQCHGEKLADWRAGVHGRRTGHWWGPKRFDTCVACHAAHAPRFSPLAPRPPPVNPHQIVWRAASDASQEDEP